MEQSFRKIMIKKHDKQFLNSVIGAINMDGQEKITTVTFMVPKSTILIILHGETLS